MKSDEKALFEMKSDEKALSDEELKSFVVDEGATKHSRVRKSAFELHVHPRRKHHG